jgi:F-type H+-transporting ATPase subunit b
VQLSLTTFFFEIVNFLVLVWILKRLFIGPVKKIIEERKNAVAKTLRDADMLQTEARELQEKYENRVRDWSVEKEQARGEFQKEMEEEKARQLKRIEADIENEREKFRIQRERESAEFQGKTERAAMKQAWEFVSRVLLEFGSPEIEAKIIGLTVNRLGDSGSDLRRSLQSALQNQDSWTIVVRSAFPVTEGQKGELEEAFRKILGKTPLVRYLLEKKLGAGLEIDLGSSVIRASLSDELQYFAQGSRF